MYPYASSHHTASDAHTRRMLDTVVTCGPFAGHLLAAQERQQDAARRAAVWAATHAARERRPGTGRRWLGALLVRAGGRLQGAAGAPPRADPAGGGRPRG